MGSRRGKGTQVPPRTTSDIELSASNSSATTVISVESTPRDETELLAIKLNRSIDKVTRFESHQEYLMACIKDKLIPTNFKIELDPSIGNHNEAFLSTWYDKIQKFSLDLMKDTVKFCEKTVNETKTEIKVLEDEIKNQADSEEYNEIKTAITKYNEQKVRELQRIKTAKHRHLRWNLTSRQTKQQTTRDKQTTTKEKIIQQPYTQRRQQNPGDESATPKEAPTQTKPRTYADILKPKYNQRTTLRTPETTTHNDPRRHPTTTRTQIQTPTPITQFQPSRNTNTHNYSKNEVSPQPRNLEGGMQDLLTTTMQAFELLRNNFERLIDLKMTQMDE